MTAWPNKLIQSTATSSRFQLSRELIGPALEFTSWTATFLLLLRESDTLLYA